MERLKVFEGVPPPFDAMKRVVVPDALRVTHLKPSRNFAVLGPLCSEVGWRHGELITRLEGARKEKSAAFHVKKKAAVARVEQVSEMR